jgi:hypothetical protein
MELKRKGIAFQDHIQITVAELFQPNSDQDSDKGVDICDLRYGRRHLFRAGV